jgi:hypothetical protein
LSKKNETIVEERIVKRHTCFEEKCIQRETSEETRKKENKNRLKKLR